MVHTIYAPGAAIEHRNFYCKRRVQCTAEERKTASLLGGQKWNIISNKDDKEVFLKDVRNSDHFMDEEGRATSHWCHRRRRIDLDGDGIMDVCDSSNVQEVLACPATAGKEDAKQQSRQAKQLCQASAPLKYGQYSARRSSTVAPPTPGRAPAHSGASGSHDKQLPFQQRLRDVHAATTPRTLDRGLWSARRGESRAENQAPEEHELYRRVDQLRTESHIDVRDHGFADAIHSARCGSLGASGTSAVAGASTLRSNLGESIKPCAASTGPRFSSTRVEAVHSREISSWPFERDRLKRGDPFHSRPMQQGGASSVKFDILSNERKSFVY